MDGAIDWSALPFLAELHQVGDMELLAVWLVKIRAGIRAQGTAAAPLEGPNGG
jgi:hypothetical protein